MSAWLPLAGALTYLAGIGGLAHLIAHFWADLVAENPKLNHTNPAIAPLVLTFVVIAWPLTVPYALLKGRRDRSTS